MEFVFIIINEDAAHGNRLLYFCSAAYYQLLIQALKIKGLHSKPG